MVPGLSWCKSQGAAKNITVESSLRSPLFAAGSFHSLCRNLMEPLSAGDPSQQAIPGIRTSHWGTEFTWKPHLGSLPMSLPGNQRATLQPPAVQLPPSSGSARIDSRFCYMFPMLFFRHPHHVVACLSMMLEPFWPSPSSTVIHRGAPLESISVSSHPRPNTALHWSSEGGNAPPPVKSFCSHWSHCCH